MFGMDRENGVWVEVGEGEILCIRRSPKKNPQDSLNQNCNYEIHGHPQLMLNSLTSVAGRSS